MSDIMGENEPNEPYRYKYNKLVVAACRDDAIRERVQRPRPCLMQRERERERETRVAAVTSAAVSARREGSNES